MDARAKKRPAKRVYKAPEGIIWGSILALIVKWGDKCRYFYIDPEGLRWWGNTRVLAEPTAQLYSTSRSAHQCLLKKGSPKIITIRIISLKIIEQMVENVKSIFISSTYNDLIPERNIAIETIESLDSTKAIAMERFTAHPNPPKEVCLPKLRNCDAVVLIFSFELGSEDIEEKISITEIEYNEAKNLKLPVFVFIKNNSKGKWQSNENNTDRKEKLKKFKKLLDSEKTRVTFQNPEELGTKIVSAIYNFESENGEIGIRNPHFLTGDAFFEPYLDKKSFFNHCHPFFGRTEVFSNMCNFVESKKPILIIHGRGGIGKSKLLFELFTKFSNNPQYKFWFLRENVQISDDTLRQIPLKKKNIIIVDDAHHQNDLKDLIKLAKEFPKSIQLIFSLRNYGLQYLRSQSLQCGFNPHDIEVLPEIVELKRPEMEDLADSILDANHKIFSDALVHVARDSPLVLVIGAKFVNENSINPSLLERDKDFQDIVFEKFTDAHTGNLSAKFDKDDIKKILTLFSAIQPINLNNSGLLERISKSVKIEKHELNLIVAELETAGVLIKKGNLGLRITPDVFSDYILSEVCVAKGRLTGYAEKVFDEFYDISPNEINLNFAELDWRIQKNGLKIDVMSQIWEKIFIIYQQSSNLGRHSILTNIEKIAYLQPSKSLDLIEFALANPSSQNERFFGFTEFTHDTIKSDIPKILQKISYTTKYLPKCCDILWELGKDKDGILSSDTSHPIRILQELAEYKIHKSLTIQSIILDAVERWMQEANVHAHVHSPLDIIDPMLKKDGEDSRFTSRHTFEFAPFAISYKNTQKIRNRALSLIFSSANEKSTRPVMRSLNSLMNALHPPRALYGRKISNDEYLLWLPEERKILNFLESLIKKSKDPIIRISLSQRLLHYSDYQRNEENRKKADLIRNRIRNTYEVRLVRALMYSFERKRPLDFQKDREITNIKITQTIKEFVSKNESYSDAYVILNSYIQKFNKEKLSPDSGVFFSLLGKNYPEYSQGIYTEILSQSNSSLCNYCSAILSGIRDVDPTLAKKMIISGLKCKNDSIHRPIAFGYSNGWWQSGVKRDELPLVEILLKSKDKYVKKCAIESLSEFPSSEDKKIKKIALNLDIESDFSQADALFKLFFGTQKKPALVLTKPEIQKIMMKLKTIPSLERHADTSGFFICNFFKYVGERNPDAIISLFLERIKHFYKKENHALWDRYEPIPFLSSFDCFENFTKHPNYQNLLRKVCDNALSTKKRTYFEYLFSLLSDNYSTDYLAVFDDWIDSNDEEKILLIGDLIQKAPPEFLFTNSNFVQKILESAFKLNQKCFKKVKDGLFSIARCGSRVGTIGEPFPLDVKIKTEAEKYAQKFPQGSVTEQFYRELSEKADNWIRTSIIADDEEFEE